MTKVTNLTLLLLAAEAVLATPISHSNNKLNIGNLKNIHWPDGRPVPVKVTTTPSGQKVGWVRKGDQVPGKIASPPPTTNLKLSNGKKAPKPELAVPGVETGPEGTVPFQLLSAEDVQKIANKQPPPTKDTKLDKRAGNGHYYGNSGQSVTNYGGCSYLSCFVPQTGIGSMSLIQIAVANNAQGYGQTAESGWQVYPGLNNGSYLPHVFTYYTTNGYQQQGDYQGGYNTLVKGFVQTSSTYYPGMTFSTFSTVGGSQYEFPLSYQFFQGNWWVSVSNNWMGYYPGTLYAKTQAGCSSPCITKTLGSNADYIGYYGETYDDPGAPPKTDMGSGQFANQHYGKAAYMHNLLYYSQISGGGSTNYNGASGVSNASWYTIEPHFNSGESWASYFFVGGPGAG